MNSAVNNASHDFNNSAARLREQNSVGPVLCRHADPLLRSNLPPLLGRRDAAFDAALQLITQKPKKSAERLKLYWQMVRLLEVVRDDSAQILQILSSNDTRTRERKFLAFASMLCNIAASLANFYELQPMMLGENRNILYDDANNFNDDECGVIAERISSVETTMRLQLQESFEHSLHRVQRYREYAAKSFSPENADRYHSAYESFSSHCREFAEKLTDNNVTII